MDLHEYLAKMVNIQNSLLEFICSRNDIEEKYQNLIILLQKHEVLSDKNEFTLFLRLLSKISKNHSRPTNFFDKIFQILNYIKSKIQDYFTNEEIFKLFKKNKRILLFLVEEKIMTIDYAIYNIITNYKYSSQKYRYYFFPEIKSFINQFEIYYIVKDLEPYFKYDKETKTVINENIEKFKEKRRIGENDEYICELIRKDSIEEFITYVNKTDYSINTTLANSIFETNYFLSRKRTNLIEYASFFGSIQIFKYLYLNGVDLQPSLWMSSVHGFDQEIFQILVEKNIEPNNNNYDECLKESIKCHHVEITNYINNNFIESDDDKTNLIFLNAIKYYNFINIYEELVNQSSINQFIIYDYYNLVKILLTNKNIDVNSMEIIKIVFKYNFKRFYL